MTRIYKYPLTAAVQEVEMPAGSRILHVAMQGEDNPCMWAMVDPAQPLVKRKVATVPTGHDFDFKGWEYLGTIMFARGALVFHVFVLPEIKNS